jgi:pyrophosphatase PpaX
VRFPVVLFDLDGTLIDSTPMILASFQHATRTVLGREIPAAEIFAVVGGPTLEAQMRSFSPERVDELVAVYRAHNTPLHQELELCAGMGDALATLKAEGRKLGIVTSKRRKTAQLALDRLEIEHYFDTIATSDDTATHKPSPEPVQLALERLGVEPRDAAYVGDSPYDVGSARAAGVFAVAVSWGGMHNVEDADAVVANTEELLAVL